MERLGKLEKRKILYYQVRNRPGWKSKLPGADWIAFIVADREDHELIPPVAKVLVDRGVSVACCAGQLGCMVEEYIDEEIAWREVEGSRPTSQDLGDSPITTVHASIDEGLWFAAKVASRPSVFIESVVCIDLTKKKVKSELKAVMDRIEAGWMPSD